MLFACVPLVSLLAVGGHQGVGAQLTAQPPQIEIKNGLATLPDGTWFRIVGVAQTRDFHTHIWDLAGNPILQGNYIETESGFRAHPAPIVFGLRVDKQPKTYLIVDTNIAKLESIFVPNDNADTRWPDLRPGFERSGAYLMPPGGKGYRVIPTVPPNSGIWNFALSVLDVKNWTTQAFATFKNGKLVRTSDAQFQPKNSIVGAIYFSIPDWLVGRRQLAATYEKYEADWAIDDQANEGSVSAVAADSVRQDYALQTVRLQSRPVIGSFFFQGLPIHPAVEAQFDNGGLLTVVTAVNNHYRMANGQTVTLQSVSAPTPTRVDSWSPTGVRVTDAHASKQTIGSWRIPGPERLFHLTFTKSGADQARNLGPLLKPIVGRLDGYSAVVDSPSRLDLWVELPCSTDDHQDLIFGTLDFGHSTVQEFSPEAAFKYRKCSLTSGAKLESGAEAESFDFDLSDPAWMAWCTNYHTLELLDNQGNVLDFEYHGQAGTHEEFLMAPGSSEKVGR